jgi:hypothetical protein
MYLYVWKTGAAKEVTENPSAADLLAVQQGMLMIFRFTGGCFLKLIVQSDKLLWQPVLSASILKSSDARLHV